MSIKHYLILLSIFLFTSNSLYSQIIYANQGGTAQDIVNTMIGPGLTVTNPVISCPNVAYGTFSNGQTSNIGINSGVVLTTGNINTLNGPATATNWSTTNGSNCNDPQLTLIEPQATDDCCILEFDVVPSCSTLLIRFVFGSEEYPEFAPPNNSNFNDAFGFFVTGPNPSGPAYANTNVATLPDNTTIVSINNINAITNNSYYINNSTGTSIKLDAFTTVITREITVTPCEIYHFKMAIADAGDGAYDSGVFIDFLDCSSALNVTASTTPVSCAGSDGTATATAINGFPPYTYSWNTTPPQTTPTISGLTPGTYTVTVDDAGTCTPPVVQTVTVALSNNVPVIVTNDPVICEVGSATITASNPGSGGTYLWSTGETTQSIVVSPTVTTNYTVTYDAGALCTATDTSTVYVVTRFTPTFDTIPSICHNSPSPILSLNSVDSISIAGTWSPTLIDSSIIGITTYSFTPNPGECAFPTTMDITVIAPDTTTFNPISALCQGTTPIALPASSSNIPTITGTWNAPIIATNNSGITNYVFTPDSSSCATNDTLVITINPTPIISLSPNQTICQGQQAIIYSTVGDSESGGTYDWQPVDSTTADLTYFPDSTMIFSLVYTLNGCPSLPAYSTVTVNPNIPVFGGNDTLFCIGGSITLHATGTPIIEWDAPVVDSVEFTPTETATYTVYGTSDNGCITVDNVTVVVVQTPIIDPGTPPTVCVGQPVTLNATGAGTGATYSWNFGVLNGVPFVATQNKVYTVTGVDQYGCVGQASIAVTALPLPIADFTPSSISGYVPLNVIFTNNSANANNFVWDFGNGLDTITTNYGNTFTNYSIAPQDYLVYLVASNGYCTDTVSKIVKALLQPEIFVPNVFSPNDDQSNDIFFVTSQNLASLELLIFNRWGNLMATINNPLAGWDGKTSNGNDATEGVYFYKYIATGQAGEEIKGQGFLTLVR
jgi:gliding motility-associated-like protein